MNAKKIIRTIFSPDIFKLAFVLVSILGVCPLIGARVDPFLKLFHLYAVIVIAFDLFGERRLLRNKCRILLVIFAACYMVTIITNRTLLTLTNLSNFCYLLAEMGLIFSYGESSKKFDRISSYILCTFISICNAIGIGMFYAKTHLLIEGRGYIGIYPHENRLSGLFGNPNVLGLVCLCAIGLCAISFIMSKRTAQKVYFGILCAINVLTLLLANSRTQIYALILASSIIVFFAIFRSPFNIKRALLAGGAAMLCALIIPTALSLTQQGLSRLDFHYDFYVNNICLDYRSPIDSTQKNGLYTEDGVTYYYENDQKKAAGLIGIEGVYYYIDSSCKVVYGTHKIEDTNDIIPAGTYEFDEDGKLLISDTIKNGIYTEDGIMYYYKDNKKSNPGLVKIDEDYYYIDSSCKVVFGSVNVTKTNGLLPAATYRFGEDGKMLTGDVGDIGYPAIEDDYTTISRLETAGFNGRLELWMTGLKLLKSKPLFGYGLDNLTNAIEQNNLPPLITKGNLHNAYIDVLVSCGLCGFACLVSFLLVMLGETIKFFRFNDGKTWIQGAVMLGVVVAFLFDGMADSTLLSSFYPTSVCFWFISSQFTSLMEAESKRNGHYKTGTLEKLTDKIFNKIKKR